MRPRPIALALCLLGLAFLPHTAAAAGKPSIRIVSPANGTILHGSTVSIRVAVKNFKLVAPVLLPPPSWKTIPLLRGNQGHIHYVLDSVANMALTRDVVVRTTHTWTGVKPGPHTIIAYLATSQHAPFPGVPAASIHILVEPKQSKRAATHPNRKPVLRETEAPHGVHLPKTGADRGRWPLTPEPLLAALLAIVAGSGLRRYGLRERSVKH